MSEIKAVAGRLLQAAQFAAEPHATQRRKGNGDEPYVNHAIEVARTLAEVPGTFDEELVIAGLLHDTIEDVQVTREELAARFGERVASLVAEVTDDKRLDKHVRKSLQIENAPKKSAAAQNLSTADKICNLRSTLSNPPRDWTVDRRREYFVWAKAVVDRYASLDPALKTEFDATFSRIAELDS